MFISSNNRASLSILVLVVFTLSLASSAPASVILTGEVSPADIQSWIDGAEGLEYYIGKTAGNSGSLSVSDGSAVESEDCYLGGEAGSAGSVSVRGWGAKWTNHGWLGIGSSGTGSLIIENHGLVVSDNSAIGGGVDSSGEVRVSGSYSRWTTFGSLMVGFMGSGSLIIEDGASVRSGSTFLAFPVGTGTAKVTGAGSTWIVGVPPYSSMPPYSFTVTGTLLLEDGGTVQSYETELHSRGSAMVTGDGSSWSNRDGFTMRGGTLTVSENGRVATDELTLWPGASLNITTGGAVSVQELSTHETSSDNHWILAVDIGHGSAFTVGDGTGELENDGIIRLLAGPTPAAGSEHSPIAAGSWTGTGTHQALGGKWDGTSHVFTVSETHSGIGGETLSIDLSDCQRALIEDTATGQAAGISFLAKTGPGNSFDLTATALSPAEIAALDGLTAPQGLLLGGWDFTAAGSGYDPTDPVYLSLEIRSCLDRDNVTIWRYDGTAWNNLAPHDLACADGYASFTAEGLGTFAIAVPEPSVLVFLGIATLAILSRRRLPGCSA